MGVPKQGRGLVRRGSLDTLLFGTCLLNIQSPVKHRLHCQGHLGPGGLRDTVWSRFPTQGSMGRNELPWKGINQQISAAEQRACNVPSLARDVPSLADRGS